MIALCVDDEELLLNDLVRAVEASKNFTEVAAFKTYTEAVEWANDHDVDVAFLDIKLRGYTGLQLAEALREKHPYVSVIFCTGYREYAFEAFQIHVDGYLIKPVTVQAVQNEIKRLNRPEPSNRLTVHCFGTFDVLKNGKPLSFKRKRAKEVLAFLVDRRGARVTAREICAVLWEDEGDSDNNLMVLYKLTADLRAALEAVGEPNVFIKDTYDYYIDISKIDCDYYRFLAGDPQAVNEFRGEYMTQYSWAEETTARLDMGKII